MSEYERILMECRYLLSLNKNYDELADIFKISVGDVVIDLKEKLPKYDTILYKRVKYVLNKNNST